MAGIYFEINIILSMSIEIRFSNKISYYHYDASILADQSMGMPGAILTVFSAKLELIEPTPGKRSSVVRANFS